MGLWSRLFRWRPAPADTEAEPSPAEPTTPAPNTVDLPTEPFVFECQTCGKVFEARRKHPRCPACDGTDVSQLSE